MYIRAVIFAFSLLMATGLALPSPVMAQNKPSDFSKRPSAERYGLTAQDDLKCPVIGEYPNPLGFQRSMPPGQPDDMFQPTPTPLPSVSAEELLTRASSEITRRQRLAAIEEYNQLLELYPETVTAYRLRGDTYVIAQDFDSAVDDYRCVVLANPTRVEDMEKLASYYRRANRETEGIAFFEDIAEFMSGNIYAYLGLGAMYHEMWLYEQALAQYDLVLEYETHHTQGYDLVRGYYLRGKTYAMLGDYQAALSDFQYAINRDPYNVTYHNARAETHLLFGEYDRAATEFDYGASYPADLREWIRSLRGRGRAFLGQQRYDFARTDLERSRDLNFSRYNETNPVYLWLGEIELAQGNTEAAVDWFRDAAFNVPSDAFSEYLVEQAYGMLALANLLAMQGNNTRATELHNFAGLLLLNYITQQEPQSETLPAVELESTLTVEAKRDILIRIPFEGEEGMVVDISAENPALASGRYQIDPVIVLMDSNRQVLTGDDNSGRKDYGSVGMFDAAISAYRLPKSDQYTLFLGLGEYGTEGNITITLTQVQTQEDE